MIIAAIDNPSPLSEVSDEFQVQGWVFSNSGLITLAKAICCGREFPLRLGLARPEVLSAHPEICRNEFVGFDGDLKISRPEEETGSKIAVLVEFEDSTGDRHELQIEIMPAAASGAAPQATFQHGFDLPVQGSSLSDTLAVEGWVLSKNLKITRAELEAGGETIELSFGWPRPDVVNHFKIDDSFVHCGFRGFIIPRQVGKLPFEVRFFSGETLVQSVPSEATIAVTDPPVTERYPQPESHLTGLAARYIDLLSHTLNGSIYSKEVNRSDGRDWPSQAHTMLGMKRLNHLRRCVETVLHEGIEGDFIETGVWKGGSCVLMRGILKAAGNTNRKVWVADSFQGLPKPDSAIHPLDEGDSLYIYQDLVIPLEQVKSTFRSYDLLDQQVEFIPGWFCDTLPVAPIEKLAVLRLDGDMYESTIDALNSLYEKLQPGGFCIIDDYGCIPACRAAVHDFRREHGINDPIHAIDWTGAFWRKQTLA